MEDAEKKKVRHKRYNLKHREEINEKRRLYYQTHKEQCKNCSKEWDKNHLEHKRELSRKYQYNIKMEVFGLLGNKCVNPYNQPHPNWCNDVRCLQVDHVNGGGIKEGKMFRSTYSYYRMILEKIKVGSKDYQLLCANCNWIKRYINNENANKRSV
jgi:hypothetical protein